MDISLEKLELIKKITETDNPSILKKIRAVFKKETKDFYDELSNEQREAIQEGLLDIQEGRVVSYEEFKKEFGLK